MYGDEYPIVAGVDGSSGSYAALRWAVAEAGARHCRLRIIHACRRQPVDTRSPWFAHPQDGSQALVRQVGDALLAAAVDRVDELDKALDVEPAVVQADATRALLDESHRARLVVLGSRRLKAVGSTGIGSVGAAVAARAACPVVVVRGETTEPDPAIVAGVDGTDASDMVLEFAFEQAIVHSLPLCVVLCWRSTSMWRIDEAQQPRIWLSETIARWWEKYPDIPVRPEMLDDPPVAGLVSASQGQRLLVVGSRGRPALVGTLLGSVSQRVLHRATCPVAVVPTHAVT